MTLESSIPALLEPIKAQKEKDTEESEENEIENCKVGIFSASSGFLCSLQSSHGENSRIVIRIVVCRGRDYALLYDRERQLDELVDPEPFRSNLKRDVMPLKEACLVVARW